MFHLTRLIQNTLRSGCVWSCLLATSLYSQLPAESHAADKFWNNTSGGTFSTSSNWQSCGFFCNPVAGPNDVAHFGISSPPSPFQFVYTVSFSGNATTNSMLVEDDLVTFDLNAHTYTNSHSPFTVATQIGNVAGRFGQLSVTDGLLDINSVVFVGIAGGTGNLTISQGGRVQSDLSARVGASGSNGAVVVNGSTSQWVHAGELSVGWGGSGTMSITGGALVQNNRGNIADGSSPGTVSVSGTNSRWINSDLFVGNGGTATLNITASGRVQSTTGHVAFVAGHTGAVNIDAGRWINSGDLFLGDLGAGTMNITGGGEVQNFGAAIGAAAGSTGGVTVSSSTNIASNWLNSGELNIGHSGSGTLDILTGGAVFNTNGFLGRFAGSTGVANVSGPDASWRNTGNLTVGNNGDGELNVTSRGIVESVDGTIGAGAGSTGSVTLMGPLAFWFNSGILRVGDNGHGTLSITNGGHAQAATIIIGQEMGSVGEVTVDGAGSELRSSGLILVSGFGGGTGRLTVVNGGVVSAANGLSVRPRGTLLGDGQIVGSVANLGVISPGASPGTSPGTLSIDGDYTQTSNGILRIEVASAASFSKLVIAGSATFAGTLDIDRSNVFTPAAGDNYDILDWTTLTGTFLTLDLPTLPAGLMWNASQLYTNGVLSVGLIGDYNLNGIVDSADYTVYRNTLGQMGTGLAADGNGNNQIDSGDYDVWRAHFGQTAGSSSGANANAAVPEPATLVLLMFAMVGWCFRRGQAG